MLERAGVRWLLTAGGVAAGLGGIVLGETLVRPSHEVLYFGAVSIARCVPAAAPAACILKYSITVANIGKEKQDHVRIELPVLLPQATVGTRVSDLIASARPTPQPRIRQEAATASTVFVVSELEPNTVVDIDLTCVPCERAILDAFRGIRAKVEARGRVSEADPRVSTFKKGVTDFLRMVGIFR